MATTVAKTVLATGATSGLVRDHIEKTGLAKRTTHTDHNEYYTKKGFEMVKQLLSQVEQPYKFILGARDTAKARTDFESLGFDTARHSLTILPLQLTDLAGVRAFAKKALEDLDRSGDGRLDYLVLNAAAAFPANTGDSSRSKWCDTYIINYLCGLHFTAFLATSFHHSQIHLCLEGIGFLQGLSDHVLLTGIC